MGLDDFADSNHDSSDDNSSSGNKYVTITAEEFEEAIDELPYAFMLAADDDSARFTGENVYKAPIDSILAPDDLEIRIYSSIDKQTLESRDKGTDAIRTVVYSTEFNRVVGGAKRTHRTPGWDRRVREKVEELMDRWNEAIRTCDECGAYMVKRDGQYGEFFGCLNYPECQYTRQIED